MVTIRQNVFETNSSSMHSLCITSNTEEDDLRDEQFWIHDGIWRIREDDLTFERYPFRILCRFSDKVKYLIASLCGSYTNSDEAEKNLDEIRDVCKDVIPEFKDFAFEVDFAENPYYGYAQNYGSFETWLKANKVSAKDFLLSKKYIIICDGDEYCEWEKVKASGLINLDIIKEEVTLS